MDRDPILVEREKTHGKFDKTARIAMRIKNALRDGVEYKSNDFKTDEWRQAEALDMIATKMARISSGNGKDKDHWLDIAGYAKLGAEACE